MKYTIRQIAEGEDEVILNYRHMTPDVERILNFLNGEQQKIRGWKEKTLVLLEVPKILYIESIDGKTFAYTEEDVIRIDYTLNRLEQLLDSISFFRCSKSMILNIDKVERLKSLPSNRIDATMCNGEHLMISRTYASDFRKRLRGGVWRE
ncbi:MAG TPA: LytTR family transcriptional regulator [Lachnospiraceae bacterium]|nr:LytTR family transcriptional regulator [Lachnospiraceae bacterium]